MGIPTIHIYLDKKCKKCGKGGATKSGYCMECVAKMIKVRDMEISKRKRTEIEIQFDVKAIWECENCGHKEIVAEPIRVSNYGLFDSELVWCLDGVKQKGECPKCQDIMRIMPIDDSFFIDLTPFQKE